MPRSPSPSAPSSMDLVKHQGRFFTSRCCGDARLAFRDLGRRHPAPLEHAHRLINPRLHRPPATLSVRTVSVTFRQRWPLPRALEARWSGHGRSPEEGAWTPWQYPDWEVEMFAPRGAEAAAPGRLVLPGLGRRRHGRAGHQPHGHRSPLAVRERPLGALPAQPGWCARRASASPGGHAGMPASSRPAGDWWMVYHHGLRERLPHPGAASACWNPSVDGGRLVPRQGRHAGAATAAPRGGRSAGPRACRSATTSRAAASACSGASPCARRQRGLRGCAADGGLVIQGKGRVWRTACRCAASWATAATRSPWTWRSAVRAMAWPCSTTSAATRVFGFSRHELRTHGYGQEQTWMREPHGGLARAHPPATARTCCAGATRS